MLNEPIINLYNESEGAINRRGDLALKPCDHTGLIVLRIMVPKWGQESP